MSQDYDKIKMVAMGLSSEIRSRPGQRSEIFSIGHSKGANQRRPVLASNFRAKSWRSKELNRSSQKKALTSPNLFTGSSRPKKAPVLENDPKDQSAERDLLKQKLQEQSYFKKLKELGSDQAQRNLLNWFDQLISAAERRFTNLNAQLTLSGSQERVSVKEWLELVVQDQHSPQEKAKIEALKFHEKQQSPLRKGNFWESRFKIALEVLKALGIVGEKSDTHDETDWQNTIGIDSTVELQLKDDKHTRILPVQLKSTADKAAKFFTKDINYKSADVLRKRILCLDMSSFSISQLMDLLTGIKNLRPDLCNDLSKKDSGSRELEISAQALHLTGPQKVKLIKSTGFYSKSEQEQEELIARQYLEPAF